MINLISLVALILSVTMVHTGLETNSKDLLVYGVIFFSFLIPLRALNGVR